MNRECVWAKCVCVCQLAGSHSICGCSFDDTHMIRYLNIVDVVLLAAFAGCCAVLRSAVLAHIFLKEQLNVFGILGCVLCITGSITIVLHVPAEKPIESVAQVWNLAMQPGACVVMHSTRPAAWACQAISYTLLLTLEWAGQHWSGALAVLPRRSGATCLPAPCCCRRFPAVLHSGVGADHLPHVLGGARAWH